MDNTNYVYHQNVIDEDDFNVPTSMEINNNQSHTPSIDMNIMGNDLSKAIDISSLELNFSDYFKTSNINKNINMTQASILNNTSTPPLLSPNTINEILNDFPVDSLINPTDSSNESSTQLQTTSDQDVPMVDLNCSTQNNHDSSHLLTSSTMTMVGTDSTATAISNGSTFSVANTIDIVNQCNVQHSHVNFKYLDVFEIAKQQNFNLTIPTQEEQIPKNKFRLGRKSFAIACYTNVTMKQVLEHIENEFNPHIQYVCISSPFNVSQTSSHPLMYIQIILRKIINKKTCFFKTIAGNQCNYRVASDDTAWNTFMKKVGNFIEVGQFQSTRSRVGIKWSQVTRDKHKQMKKKSKIQNQHLQSTNNEEIAKQAIERIFLKMKTHIKDACDLAKRDIPVECSDQLKAVLTTLESFHSLIQNHSTT